MEVALYNNKLVSVGVFQRRRASHSERARCPACKEDLFLSAAHSMVKATSFNHFPRAADQDRCLLSYKYHSSYSWLENVELEVIEARAAALRNKFFQLDNLKRAFTFLTKVAGKGAVTSPVFALLLSKADEKAIWRYAGLPVWAVPYILLSLMDFIVRREEKTPYAVRFIIDKPTRSQLNTTWLSPEQCTLSKYFVNNGGKTGNLFATGHTASRWNVPNPLPFSERFFLELTADITWVSDKLNNVLDEMAMAPIAEEDEAPAPTVARMPAISPVEVAEPPCAGASLDGTRRAYFGGIEGVSGASNFSRSDSKGIADPFTSGSVRCKPQLAACRARARYGCPTPGT